MADLPQITVILGGSGGDEVRATPVVVSSRSAFFAQALQRELRFGRWRQAVTFCLAAGIAIANEEAALQLADAEERPTLDGPCPTCGAGEGERTATAASAPPAKLTAEERYREAVIACAAARSVLREHDLAELLRAIDHADAVAPIFDPTLYRDRARAMHEDRELLEAALPLRNFGGPPRG